jgi:hypothetical protein
MPAFYLVLLSCLLYCRMGHVTLGSLFLSRKVTAMWLDKNPSFYRAFVFYCVSTFILTLLCELYFLECW